MAIEAISAVSLGPSKAVDLVPSLANGVDFSGVVARGVAEADAAVQTADQKIRAMAAGQEVAPHDLMISLEEARMHLTLLAEVRNKLVEGYQELSRMQL
ncbi:flagellar hook-basal body complex protein FliE [Xanthomonas cucurbitae]|uniref:Flagellar hook-basal body complex protein FliE n=1 Tax=Xanthomonas cucurbitae TaxID=56453 RepID=A0ABY7YCU2_9XANT|nr:flagellar hook-basal body complex protein FliE [Xanthomonas cucurbitae]WDM67824.1 flagellar hook-basal body complex protein FliE [Xanthomonas cucurbitae]WDM71698.1 flagellar hook-basal body complex protein FliE [Xanthomonas cucurbitae]